MFAARACDGCSTAPLTQYKTNEIYQEITEEDKLTTNDTGDRILVDMRRSKGYTDELEKINRDDSGLAVTIGFKETATKKLRLRVTGYSQGEYWYLLSNKVLLKNKVLKIILCHLKITIFRKQINLNKNNKCSYMRRRKYYKTNRRHKKRGRGFPYIYNNRVYFEKKTQKGTRAVSLLTKLLSNVVGGVIGLLWLKMFGLSIEKNQREKIKENIRQNEPKVLVTDLSYYIR